MKTNSQIILDTLANLNATMPAGDAYNELVRALLALNDTAARVAFNIAIDASAAIAGAENARAEAARMARDAEALPPASAASKPAPKASRKARTVAKPAITPAPGARTESPVTTEAPPAPEPTVSAMATPSRMINEKQIFAAAKLLKSSTRGSGALTKLRYFFAEAVQLDKENGEAAQTLVAGFFGDHTGATMDAVTL